MKVRSAGDGTGACEIVSVDKTIRVDLGQRVSRLPDGTIVVELDGLPLTLEGE